MTAISRIFIGFLALSSAFLPVAPLFADMDHVVPVPPVVPSEVPEVTEVIVRKTTGETVRMAVPAGKTPDEAAVLLAQQDGVLYAEPNNMVRAMGTAIPATGPNDTLWKDQWNMANTNSGVHATEAWRSTQGKGIVVAVIDTGVAYKSTTENGRSYTKATDFAADTFLPGWDFVNNDAQPLDDNGHGTHIAGTIAQGTHNGVGTAGVAPGVKILPIKVLDENAWGTYADIADGIRYAADNGADVINLSLGGTEYSRYLHEAVQYAYGKGCVIIAAAGNEGITNVHYPARFVPYVLSVGSARYDAQRPTYANYGRYIDVVAPGGDVRVDQNKDGSVDGIVQQTYVGHDTNTLGYVAYEGTSMSAAHASGVAALVLAYQGKDRSPADVARALKYTATDIGAHGKDGDSGYGMLNAGAAIHYGMDTTYVPELASVESTDGAPSDNGTDTPSANGSYSITAPNEAAAGTQMNIAWQTPLRTAGNQRSWVGIYQVGASDRRPVEWARISDTGTQGTWNVRVAEAGTYEVRLFEGATYNSAAKATVTVAGAKTPNTEETGAPEGSETVGLYTVTGPDMAPTGTVATFAWNIEVRSRDTNKSWIGVYRTGDSNRRPIHWERISDTNTKGTWSIAANTPGTYEVRLFKGARYERIAVHIFTIR